MTSAAYEDGQSPWGRYLHTGFIANCSAVRGEWFGEPRLRDFAYFEGIAASLVMTKLGSGGDGSRACRGRGVCPGHVAQRISMPDQGTRIRRCGKRGVGGGIGQGVGIGGHGLREDEREVLVEAGNEVGLRAEVRGESEASERQCAEKSGAGGAHKTLDARLAEEIDRLTRIADEEDGLRVAVPGFGEPLDEVVLSGGGVLHFVDEKMLKARAQGRGEVCPRRNLRRGRGARGG